MKVGNECPLPTPTISLLRLFSLTLKQYRGAQLVQLGEPWFLLCDQGIHDDLVTSSLHHWDLVCTVSAIESQQGRAYLPLLSLIKVLILELWNPWFSKDAVRD